MPFFLPWGHYRVLSHSASTGLWSQPTSSHAPVPGPLGQAGAVTGLPHSNNPLLAFPPTLAPLQLPSFLPLACLQTQPTPPLLPFEALKILIFLWVFQETKVYCNSRCSLAWPRPPFWALSLWSGHIGLLSIHQTCSVPFCLLLSQDVPSVRTLYRSSPSISSTSYLNQ